MRLATSLPHHGVCRQDCIWWSERDSNPRPLRCERNALPAELPPHVSVVTGGQSTLPPPHCNPFFASAPDSPPTSPLHFFPNKPAPPPIRVLSAAVPSAALPLPCAQRQARETEQNIGIFEIFSSFPNAPIPPPTPVSRPVQKNYAKKVDAVNNSALCYATTRWKWNEYMFDLVFQSRPDPVPPGCFHTPMFSKNQHILLKQNNLCAIRPQEARR